MAKKKAFIFDLDGTIANTLTSIAYFGNRALKAYGFSPIAEQKYRYLVGNGAKLLVKRMLLENGVERDDIFEQVYTLYNQSYDANPLYLTAPYPGIPETLKQLKSNNIQLAVLSNKPHSTTSQVVKALYGTELFNLVYGQREGVPLKPNPAPLLAIIKELGATPAECVYVGDTATDMQTGKNAGAFTVGVAWGFREESELWESGADTVIRSAEQLLNFME